MRTPLPLGTNLLPTMTSRRSSQEEQLEVPHPPAGVDPDGRVYQAGIRKVHPRPDQKTPDTLHPCFLLMYMKNLHVGPRPVQ